MEHRSCEAFRYECPHFGGFALNFAGGVGLKGLGVAAATPSFAFTGFAGRFAKLLFTTPKSSETVETGKPNHGILVIEPHPSRTASCSSAGSMLKRILVAEGRYVNRISGYATSKLGDLSDEALLRYGRRLVSVGHAVHDRWPNGY